jgi:fido (protein-threonine AMPylation protein)
MKRVAHPLIEGEGAATKLLFGQLLRETRIALRERGERGRRVWQECTEMTHRLRGERSVSGPSALLRR